MPKKPTTKTLKKKADVLFSQIVRRRYADKDGNVSCITCGCVRYWEKEGMQAGHFITRNWLRLRWDSRNVFPQCETCNVWNKGRMDMFSAFLVREFGGGILEELINEKRTKTMKIYDYVEMIDNFNDILVGLDIRDDQIG